MDKKEASKRGAASMANQTAGRSRVFKDKKKYDRKAERLKSRRETGDSSFGAKSCGLF